jgi:hypothetical protein
VADENIVFNSDAFTYKSVTGNFAALSHFGILLNLDKGADFSFVANFAAIKVDELRKLHVLPKFHVGSDAAISFHGSSDVCEIIMRCGVRLRSSHVARAKPIACIVQNVLRDTRLALDAAMPAVLPSVTP